MNEANLKPLSFRDLVTVPELLPETTTCTPDDRQKSGNPNIRSLPGHWKYIISYVHIRYYTFKV